MRTRILILLSLFLSVTSWSACYQDLSSMCYLGLQPNCPGDPGSCVYGDCSGSDVGGFTMCNTLSAYSFSGSQKYTRDNGNGTFTYYVDCYNYNKKRIDDQQSCVYSSPFRRNDAWVCNVRCETQCEADSIQCFLDEGRLVDDPTNECGKKCIHGCDTTMLCLEYGGHNICVDVPSSGSITCVNGNCSGLPYTMWYSEYRRECHNECGTTTTETIRTDTLVTFNSSCNDSTIKCSEQTYCNSANGEYITYKICSVGNPEVTNNGIQQKTFPSVVGGGNGSCEQNNMQENKNPPFDPNDPNDPNNPSGPNWNGPNGNGGPNAGPDGNNQTNVISDECLVYGVGCPETFNDTTNFDNLNNRNPQNCICRPFDGLGSMSQIVCPDGSVTTVFYSCDAWRGVFSSSSVASSSSANPPSSSDGTAVSSAGGGDGFGEYPEYPTDDRTFRKNTQSSLSGIGGILAEIKRKLVDIHNYLTTDDDFVYNSKFPSDSFSITYDTTRINVLDSVFAILDTSSLGLDSSLKPQTGVCPCIDAKFGELNLRGIPLPSDAELKLDTANIGGINFCAIIRAIIIGFASVVSFFVGYKLFDKASL